MWPEALYYRAYALLELGNLSAAQRDLEQAISLSPANPNYLSELGYIHQLERDWKSALQTYELAEEYARTYSPEEVRTAELSRALRGLGYVLVELGRLDEAAERYEECLDLDGSDQVAAEELKYVRQLQAESDDNPG